MDVVCERPVAWVAAGGGVSKTWDLPTPSEDVKKYTNDLDLKVLFDFLGGPMKGFHLVTVRPLFRNLQTDTDVGTLENELYALPGMSASFFQDHFNEYAQQALFEVKARERAEAAGKPFKELPPPYPRNHCRMAFAHHVSACARVMAENPGGAPGKMSLLILNPDAASPEWRSAHVLHGDEEGYRLALTVSPA